MKHVLWLACVMFLASSATKAQDAKAKPAEASGSSGASASKATGVDAQKEADIRRLMAITGATGVGIELMTGMQKTMRPLLEQSLPPGEYRARLIDLFTAKFRAEATAESLTSLLIPVYDRHFSDDEIKGLIAFYETPLGKKAVSVLPQVVSESQQAGSDWGSELGRRCMEQVLTEHPELAKELEAAEKAARTD